MNKVVLFLIFKYIPEKCFCYDFTLDEILRENFENSKSSKTKILLYNIMIESIISICVQWPTFVHTDGLPTLKPYRFIFVNIYRNGILVGHVYSKTMI